jgi:3-hydroxybutyryl-CoA dehydrogenase
MIKTIGVIGAGTMVNGIAQVFAQAGFSVMLVDIAKPMLERARASIESRSRRASPGSSKRTSCRWRIATARSLD